MLKSFSIRLAALGVAILIGMASAAVESCSVASKQSMVGGLCKCKQMQNAAHNPVDDKYDCPGGVQLCGFYRQCDVDVVVTNLVCCVQSHGCRDQPQGCTFQNEGNCWKAPCPDPDGG
jgi:hypothetical protein